MAKQTHDREDLLRDGTAMPIRGRMVIDGVEVVIGFRPSGQLSLYWAQDPVFQFDDRQHLRRAFVDGCRLKAEAGRLVRLVRAPDSKHHSVDRLRLTGEVLSAAEERRILEGAEDCLQQISRCIGRSFESSRELSLNCVGVTDVEFIERVSSWLAKAESPIPVASDASVAPSD